MVEAWRRRQLDRFEADPKLLKSAWAFYKKNCVAFINHWCTTYDPRRQAKGLSPKVPFVLFRRQAELVEFVLACINGEADGLTEKCRDAGATWVCCAISVWLWLFHDGSAVGWGSRKQELVDRIGDPSSIFEKLRTLIVNLPECFLPEEFNPDTCLHFMRIVNPKTGATIIGETGDNIGRGGRTLIYFKDESAHYQHPEKIEAALSENTRCQFDISSVNGPTTVFQRKRDAGVDWGPGRPVVQTNANVFVFDWSHHPEKTQEWHDQRENMFRNNGLYHIFAQEVERNAYAAVEGIIIDARWFDAAIDAHIKLGIEPSGSTMGSLDVADDGPGDTNALSIRRSILLQFLAEWGGRDTGETTRHAVGIVKDWMLDVTTVAQWRDMDERKKEKKNPTEFVMSYDCIGVGAGVKAEAARLRRDEVDTFPQHLRLSAWNAASAVLDPHGYVAPPPPNATEQEKRESLKNRDFFGNLKAQAWWLIARRFERTWRAVNEPDFTYDPDDLIAIPSTLPLLHKLKKEMCQPTMTKNSNLKLIVDKTPDGARSPNLADSIVMNYCPIPPRLERNIGVGGITVIGNSSAGTIQRI